MKRRTLVAGIAVAAVAAVLAAGAVMAQSEEDGGGASFLDRVAAKLGIGSDQLEQAVIDARTEQINEAVQEGDLTQEEADQLIERLDELPQGGLYLGPALRGFNFRGGDGPAFGLGFGPGCHIAGEELAEFLGMTQEQLHEELSADGATLASVAEAHGKNRDELKAFIIDTTRERLDELVANHGLEQERAGEAMTRLESNIDELIDRELPGPRFKFRFGPEGDDAPDGGADEQSGILRGAFRS